jgi:hypothetical protein
VRGVWRAVRAADDAEAGQVALAVELKEESMRGRKSWVMMAALAGSLGEPGDTGSRWCK